MPEKFRLAQKSMSKNINTGRILVLVALIVGASVAAFIAGKENSDGRSKVDINSSGQEAIHISNEPEAGDVSPLAVTSEEDGSNGATGQSENFLIKKCAFGTVGWMGLSSTERMECKKYLSKKDARGYSRVSYYPEKKVLSGEYVKYVSIKQNLEEPDFFSRNVYFLVDGNDEEKLPRNGYYLGNEVYFENVEDAEQMFETNQRLFDEHGDKYCKLSGRATIELSDFLIDNFEGGVPLQSRGSGVLDSVLSKGPYSVSCSN